MSEKLTTELIHLATDANLSILDAKPDFTNLISKLNSIDGDNQGIMMEDTKVWCLQKINKIKLLENESLAKASIETIKMIEVLTQVSYILHIAEKEGLEPIMPNEIKQTDNDGTQIYELT